MPADVYTIECQRLTKKFGAFTAVNSLDLRIRKGELFGFLGPNGAGKTTTIRMLTTLLSPTSGSASISGLDVVEDAPSIRSVIGVVPQEFALFQDLTPMENLWYIGELYGMHRDEIRRRSIELLRTVDLKEQGDKVSGDLSGGMKQKLSIAASLLHTPAVLFLDEPTIGLDPQSRMSIRELVRKLNDSGITIVYTTHDMEEADKLCDRIGIMNLGKLVALGTSEELKARHGGGSFIELRLENADERVLEGLRKLTHATSLTSKGGVVRLGVEKSGGTLLHNISNFLTKKGVGVLEMEAREPSLEDVFINLTAGAHEHG